jgi:hypothetical protein
MCRALPTITMSWCGRNEAAPRLSHPPGREGSVASSFKRHDMRTEL